jgi:predicted transcriptional regulator
MKQSKPGKLSETEREVMREVWGMTAPVTVARVLEIFSARRGWKISTLSTIMDRLIEKGCLAKALHGKANVYTPLITEAAYKERETRAFLAEVHNGSLRNFIAALDGGGGVSAEEAAEIRAWFIERADGL